MRSNWQDLLNSDYHDYLGSGKSEDRLDDPKWLKEFISRWDWMRPITPGNEIHEQLLELRKLIKRIVNSVVAGDQISSKDWESLNSYLAAAPVFQRLEKTDNEYQLKLIPIAQNLDSMYAEIALSFATIFVSGDPNRIKFCENKDCLWVFYDTTRSRTRRWCESSACGNLIKVRRFRARQKKSSRKETI